jgi:hypothetical protein
MLRQVWALLSAVNLVAAIYALFHGRAFAGLLNVAISAVFAFISEAIRRSSVRGG